MYPSQALRHIINERDLTYRQASAEIGRSENYVSRMVSGRVSLGTSVLAEIADTFGYDLVLRDRKTGEEVSIEPEVK